MNNDMEQVHPATEDNGLNDGLLFKLITIHIPNQQRQKLQD